MVAADSPGLAPLTAVPFLCLHPVIADTTVMGSGPETGLLPSLVCRLRVHFWGTDIGGCIVNLI